MQKMSLTATGTPSSARRRTPDRDRGERRRGLRAPQVGAELVRRLLVGGEPLVGGEVARLDLAERLGDRQFARIAHACGEGTRKESAALSGAPASAVSRSRLGAGSSGRSHVLERDHVGRRLDALEIELAERLDVVEDPGELARHPLDLLVGQPQPREAGDVENLFAVDH